MTTRGAAEAIRSKNLEALATLLEEGFDPNELHTDGRPWALHLAASTSSKLAELLLAYGARVDALDAFGRTALFRTKHHDVVRLMLDRGLDPNAADPRGITPLMNAADRGHEKSVVALLAAGADVNAVTRDGGTALSFAREQRRTKIVALLERAAPYKGAGGKKNLPSASSVKTRKEASTKPQSFIPLAGFEGRAGLVDNLVRLKVLPVTNAVLKKRLAAEGGKPDAKGRAFIDSKENLRRYGFELPAPLRSLLELGDRYLIEDLAKQMPSFRYLRVAPGGWEMPVAEKGESLDLAVAKRFDWNTFSNMQLWEHFAGTMSLGWDPGDNRYMVSTVSPKAPVFWMNHETAEMTQAVASSLEHFLRVQVGDDAGVPEREKALIRRPGVWHREEDGLAYLDAGDVPLTAWPPFLSARADWLVGMWAFGAPERLERPEVFVFDLERELPLVALREPLALYWSLRSFLLEEHDVFSEVAPHAKKASPLARALTERLEREWKPKAGSPSGKARAALRKAKQAPRKAKPSKNHPRDRLV